MPSLEPPPHALSDRAHSDTVVVSLIFVALLLAAFITSYLIIKGVKAGYRRAVRGRSLATPPHHPGVVEEIELKGVESAESVVSWSPSSTHVGSMRFGNVSELGTSANQNQSILISGTAGLIHPQGHR